MSTSVETIPSEDLVLEDQIAALFVAHSFTPEMRRSTVEEAYREAYDLPEGMGKRMILESADRTGRWIFAYTINGHTHTPVCWAITAEPDEYDLGWIQNTLRQLDGFD